VHQECFEFVARRLPTDITKKTTVVEFGSKDVNGNIHPLIGQAKYVGIDREDGPNVDLVMDCQEYIGKADIVLCLELLEHCDDLDGVIQSIVDTIDEKGMALVTCATDPRPEHSAYDGGPLRTGEFYKNVSFKDLEKSVKKAGGKIKYKEIDVKCGDLRAEIYVD
jgi:hypothetical protein